MEPPTPDWFGKEGEAILAATMKAERLEGLTLGIARQGETYVKGFGDADVENKVPAGPETVYRIGSLTKQFTAAAVMLLVERGSVRLNDPLARWIPEYPAHAHGITVEQLLTHTSGIKNYTEMPEFAALSRLHSTHEQIGRLFAAEPLDFPPGQAYRYSNSGYFLLGIVIERASADTYADFMERELFAPLGLEQTYYLDNYRIISHRAQGYDVYGDTPIRADQISMAAPFAAGALGSTAPDLLAWQDALTAGRLLSTDSYRQMTTPGRLNDGSRTSYGYAVMIGAMHGHTKWSHAGTISGFRAQLAHYPQDALTLALICNNGRAALEALESRLARHVLGIAEPIVHQVAMSTAELDRFAGDYRQDATLLQVVRNGGALLLNGAELRPVGPGHFVLAGDPGTQLTFDGPTVLITRKGQRSTGKRVDNES